MKRLLLACLLFAVATAGAQETVVYKTVNADGTVSYSQDPVEGAERRVVNSRGTASRAADAPPPAATPIPEEVSAGSDAAAAARKEACANASANLAVYDSGTSVTLAQGGAEPVTLTGEELAAARRRAQQTVDRYCDDATPAD